MSNKNLCSYFDAPISNTVPVRAVSIGQLYEIITADASTERATCYVRSMMADKREFNKAKTRRLAFVTPAGVFATRKTDGLVTPSGFFVVDVDGLPTTAESERIRDMVFADTRLGVALAFVSPSGHGVKFFIPFEADSSRPFADCFRDAVHGSWEYLKAVYGVEPDRANIDVARCCFVSHDAGALMRQV